MLLSIYDRKDVNTRELFTQTFNPFRNAVHDGYGKHISRVAFNSPDYRMLNELTYNVGVFSAFKNHNQIRETVKLLKDADGKPRKKEDFLKEAGKLDDAYNKRYLAAEFNQAGTAARMARRWEDNIKSSSLYPNLKYVAVNDGRTRELHKKWHGIILPINHPFWNTHYPPNDWGCRCTVRKTDQEPDDKGINADDMPALPKQFNINVGKQGKVFNDDHPYFKVPAFAKASREARKSLINFQQRELKEHVKNNLKGSYAMLGIPEKVRYSTAGVGKLVDRNKRDKSWYQTVNLIYDIKNFLTGVVFEFSEAGAAQKAGVLGRYLGYKVVDGVSYEICFRKTLAGTNFYYIRKLK